jgi:hypothetical protein
MESVSNGAKNLIVPVLTKSAPMLTVSGVSVNYPTKIEHLTDNRAAFDGAPKARRRLFFAVERDAETTTTRSLRRLGSCFIMNDIAGTHSDRLYGQR